jgi:hypothetical protein
MVPQWYSCKQGVDPSIAEQPWRQMFEQLSRLLENKTERNDQPLILTAELFDQTSDGIHFLLNYSDALTL